MAFVNIDKKYYLDFQEILETLKDCYNNVKNKIKSKLTANSNLEIYEYLHSRLTNIALNLESIPYCEREFDDFLEIRSYSLYILRKNCEDIKFGYLEDLIYLINLFKEIMEEKLELFNNFSQDKLNDYNVKFNIFHEKLDNYDDKFLFEIYESNCDNISDVKQLSKLLRDG